MRSRRLFAPALIGTTLVLLTGCTDSTSVTQRAWERAAYTTRPANQSEPNGALVASDGLGNSIFTLEAPAEGTRGQSTFAHVPND